MAINDSRMFIGKQQFYKEKDNIGISYEVGFKMWQVVVEGEIIRMDGFGKDDGIDKVTGEEVREFGSNDGRFYEDSEGGRTNI